MRRCKRSAIQDVAEATFLAIEDPCSVGQDQVPLTESDPEIVREMAPSRSEVVDVDDIVVALMHVNARLGRHLAVDRITTRDLFHVSLAREIQALAIDVDRPVGMKVCRLRRRNQQKACSSKAESAERHTRPQSFWHYLLPCRPPDRVLYSLNGLRRNIYDTGPCPEATIASIPSA